MPVYVVVGGQYGSEGKGRIVHDLLTCRQNPNRTSPMMTVRCGGPNSGHTTTVAGQQVIFRQLPSGIGVPRTIAILPAGAVVNYDLLLEEIAMLETLEGVRFDPGRLFVDRRAVLTDPADSTGELASIRGAIGSTASGNGNALIRRMRRIREQCTLVEDLSAIKTSMFTVCNTAELLQVQAHRFGDIVIEGNQGFGLSLLHGTEWPFVTSRDTTASGFLSECGLPPRRDTYVIVVMRTFPIRVAGNSGPLRNELTWEQVAEIGQWPNVVDEMTSVTKKVRRVGLWDRDLARKACMANNPSWIALMGMDRYRYEDLNKTDYKDLCEASQQFVRVVEADCFGVPVKWIGTSPTTFIRRKDV